MNAQPDKLFFARLADMVSRCGRDYAPVFSSFLDERQCAEAERWCRANVGDLSYMLWGGYDGARRKMLAVYPEYLGDEVREMFPMKCLTFTYREEDKLTHRDFLGSFMAPVSQLIGLGNPCKRCRPSSSALKTSCTTSATRPKSQRKSWWRRSLSVARS